MIKLEICLRRLPTLTREEFQRYWRENHAPLVRERAETLRIKKYVQCHTIPEDAKPPLNKAVRQNRGTIEPYDGVAELWWDSAEDMMEASMSPEGAKAFQVLLEDERKFIDLANSCIFFVEEHTVV